MIRRYNVQFSFSNLFQERIFHCMDPWCYHGIGKSVYNDLCCRRLLVIRVNDRCWEYVIQIVWIVWISSRKQQELSVYLIWRLWQVQVSVVERGEVVETADIVVTYCFVRSWIACCREVSAVQKSYKKCY